jgi:hypothetical protein
MALDIANGYLELSTSIESILVLNNYKKGTQNGLENLSFFKNELENELYHADYVCRWSEILHEKFTSADEKGVLKIISDLVSTRMEFWCISPQLYNSLTEEKKKSLFQIWETEAFNHNWNIEYDFNLFE